MVWTLVRRCSVTSLTLKALRGSGIEVRLVGELHDVDTIDDVGAVRRVCAADSRFARAARAVEA